MTINNRTRTNEEIRVAEVRVVDADGKQLGVMSAKEALKLAQEAGLDLVEISPNAKPPVCKIVDWGKYQYQKMKEQQKARKNNKGGELKQMKLGLRIGENDLNIKLRKIREFLADGQRVKIMIVFRGRELAHKEIGNQLMDKIIDLLADEAVVESAPQFAGRNLSISVRRK